MIKRIFTDKYIIVVSLLAAIELFINSAFVPPYRIAYNQGEIYKATKRVDTYKDSANCKVWHCDIETTDGKTKVIHVIVPVK